MYNLNLQYDGNYSVDHSPLKPEPRGTMPLPLTRQRFVVKPLDGPQSWRPGKSGNLAAHNVYELWAVGHRQERHAAAKSRRWRHGDPGNSTAEMQMAQKILRHFYVPSAMKMGFSTASA